MVQANPANPLLFREHHAEAQLARADRGHVPSRASANNSHIVGFRHCVASMSGLPDAGGSPLKGSNTLSPDPIPIFALVVSVLR